METRTRKWIGLALVAAVLFTIAPAAQAAFPPSGTYRIGFVTSVKPNPGSNIPADWDMTDLNTWATGLANDTASIVKDMASEWYIIGATSTVDVYTNTGLDPASPDDCPIYMSTGDIFSSSYGDMWANNVTSYPSGGRDTTLAYTELGTMPDNGGPVQTGLVSSGDPLRPSTKPGEGALDGDGSINIGHGGLNTGYNPWYGDSGWQGGTLGATRLWVISEVIPEPATMSLLAIGGVALLRRKRR